MNNHYTDSNGNFVMTSSYLRARKTCCKSACLHCPYGYTLRNSPIIIHKYSATNASDIEFIFNEKYNIGDMTQNLLQSAFGGAKKRLNKERAYLLTLKGNPCGVIEYENGKIYDLVLKTEFQDQGINEVYLQGLIS